MKLIYYFVALALTPFSLYGQIRSKEQAVRIAANILAVDNSQISLIKHVYKKNITTDDSESDFRPVYFLTDAISHRAILISGDMRMETVLGETDSALADGYFLPPALQELIDQYTKEYIFLQSLDEETKVNVYKSVAAPDVSPLISTQWGQGSPFNDKCPIGCPSGCVATAMAQIMNYHRYPDYGIGQYSYTSGIRHFKLSCDFSSMNFDWENMKNQYENVGDPDSQQRQAVANLMYACGVSVSMDYNNDGSGAYDVDVPYALINYFGYNENVEVLKRDYYSTDEWMTRLYYELESGRPVLYCGSDSKQGGHAFVVDGVRSSDSKVHVNWGWNGNSDGYYVLSSLDPGRYRFSTNQSMIANFAPPGMEVGVHEDAFYASKFVVKGPIKEGVTLTGSLTEAWCCSNYASSSDPNGVVNVVTGVGLFDGNKTFISSLAHKEHNRVQNYQILGQTLNYSFMISITGLADGDYFIAPYVQVEQSNIPTRIRTLGGKTDVIAFSVIDGTINGEKNTDEPIDPSDIDIVWREDFEETMLSSNFSQNIIQGTGNWESCIIVFSSSLDKMPSPAHGKGYAYLQSQALSLTGKRDVCQLVTSLINLSAEEKYRLTFNMRKYSKKKDSNDAVNILVQIDEDDWQILHEASVETTSSWETYSVELPEHVSRIRLAFEGCVGQGSTLFLDNIIISRYDTDYIMNGILAPNNDCYEIYSSEGKRLSVPQRGLNIIRMKDGSVKKLMMK